MRLPEIGQHGQLKGAVTGTVRDGDGKAVRAGTENEQDGMWGQPVRLESKVGPEGGW